VTKSSSESEPARAPRALILLPLEREHANALGVRVFGLTAVERLERGLPRVGVERIDVLAPNQDVPTGGSDDWIVVRADLFYDERLLIGLVEKRDVLLQDELPGSGLETLAAHVPEEQLTKAVEVLRTGEVGLETRAPAFPAVPKLDLAPAYNPTLRKYDPPFVFRAEPKNVRRTENHIFRASYKGITDLVTKWVWPLPAREVVRVISRRGVTPNTITAISYLLTFVAIFCFMKGWFVAGLISGWGMTFLDTVDGKLARCTLTSSQFGHILDHALDLIHPPIWWAAWAYGVSGGSFEGLEFATWIVVGGYVTARLLEGVFLLFFDQELFTWRPFDAFFRTIIARRNPNLIILSVSLYLGEPGKGFLWLAGWTVVANVVPAIRIAQAFALKRRGGTIQSWYEEKERAKGGAPAADASRAG